ncbi:GNAT family N-acetyltransferase [Sphingobacterium hungaricum]|uniref:GNAT family N-acetyltransferase n=1 Tax=Sphingobacterium hungaricum TaxID=2082723 RepID=A0A928UV60_9SPHI|nr:N-acetyltransferase [Sphingobacterium hungaricum]MBE8712146.1 GNAT family N-acetyltransferase [Sphingobacterium hungaricum]
MQIRQENPGDYKAVFALLEHAFRNEVHSDHKEQFLVEDLRKSAQFIPELSLVAELENKIVGYILLTKIKIKNTENEYTSLALAPVAVHPDYQNQGIGAELIRHAHQKAKELNFDSIILLGHQDYYPKFGYKPAKSIPLDRAPIN